MRLYFYAGSDIVQRGLVELFCSKGLKVLEPNTDIDEEKWTSNCSFKLKSCQPGEKLTMIVTVKCDAIDSYTVNSPLQDKTVGRNIPLQTLDAVITTSYHHKLYANELESGALKQCAPMSAILQANVTTLERPALTISDSQAFFYSDNAVVLNATVNCNTPVPFSLKKWNVTFPSYLILEVNGDLNDGLFNRSVIEGEELFFGFKCTVKLPEMPGLHNERPLLNIILQDHFGKSFLQVLPLNIDGFYEMILNECNGNKSNSATMNFSLTSNEGLVGLPVTFKCDIDCSSLNIMDTSDLLYSLTCDDSDWIIGGKIRGALNMPDGETCCSLEFVGIPTTSGEIKRFPKIELIQASSPSSSIKVTSKYPLSFMSRAHKSIETVAHLSFQQEI